MDSKFLIFEKLPTDNKRVTDKYNIVSKNGGNLIGVVAWYAPWRRYTFLPMSNTVWDSACCSDIVKFLDKIMREHKQK